MGIRTRKACGEIGKHKWARIKETSRVYLYTSSEGKFTIFDLHGENKNRKFTLCDIEFTNTLGKFGYGDELIKEYIKLLEKEIKERNSWCILF